MCIKSCSPNILKYNGSYKTFLVDIIAISLLSTHLNSIIVFYVFAPKLCYPSIIALVEPTFTLFSSFPFIAYTHAWFRHVAQYLHSHFKYVVTGNITLCKHNFVSLDWSSHDPFNYSLVAIMHYPHALFEGWSLQYWQPRGRDLARKLCTLPSIHI